MKGQNRKEERIRSWHSENPEGESGKRNPEKRRRKENRCWCLGFLLFFSSAFWSYLLYLLHRIPGPILESLLRCFITFERLKGVFTTNRVPTNFSFIHLPDVQTQCACSTTTQLRRFCDLLLLNEHFDFAPGAHVCTMDLDVVQHPRLRQALKQGLNHIVLRPTNIAEVVATALESFDQLVSILHLDSMDFLITEARSHLHIICLHTFKAANWSNKYGFRHSGQFLLEMPAVKNELLWLAEHLYFTGLDKVVNNACFMYIKHICLQAFQRLMGTDFTRYKDLILWSLSTSILDMTKLQLIKLLPECLPIFNALPYLIASYKLHKTKYKWLTNAFQTVFSNLAILLILTSTEILESIKLWAKVTERGIKNFLHIDTSLYWIIDSMMDATLNFPEKIHDIFVVDITCCYESILL